MSVNQDRLSQKSPTLSHDEKEKVMPPVRESGSEYVRRVNANQIGRRVKAVDGAWEGGVIIGGDLLIGRWTVRRADGAITEECGPDMMEEAP